MHWRVQNLPSVPLAGVALRVGLAAALWWPAQVGAQTLQTIAGGRTNLYGPDCGFADGDSTYESQFHTPMGCVVDAGTNLLVADYANGAIRKLNFVLNTTTTIITNLNGPIAVARDRTNNVYVLNTNGTVLKYHWWDTSYRSPQTLSSDLYSPTALVLDAETNLYITELGGGVKRLRVTDGLLTHVCAGLSKPRGVAALDNGLLAVSQSGSNVICLIDPATRSVTRQIGTGAAGFADGHWAEAQFNQPHQMAKAPNGTLVVADRLNHRVRLVTTNGLVTTLYGVDSNLWVGPCYTCNPIALPGWYDGVNGGVSTAEAREPYGVTVDKDGTVYTTEVYYHIIRRVTNTGLGGTGGGEGNTNVVAQAPVVEPLTGYYPMGVGIQVVNPNFDPVLASQVFYTTDGSEPGADNPSSKLLALDTNNVGVIAWREATRDLSSLRVKAFLGSVGSPTVSGQPAAANQVGLSSDVTAGIGATVVVPVVATLKPGQALRSLQFLVEIAPLGNTNSLTAPVRALAMSPNDYVALKAASTNAPLTRSETVGGAIRTNRLEVAFIGTNAAFNVDRFAAVTLLAVTIPPTAKTNDRYRVAVLSPSGTADGVAQDVPLAGLPPRLITVTNQSYLVGDVAPASWYNAGGFGDGSLKNNDVNNALYASLGVRVPPFFTDAFDGMDTFPEDTSDAVGGDGKIRFLDWQILLDRSLGFRTNNWRRCWSAGGVRVATNAPPSGRSLLSAESLQTAQTPGTLALARLNAQAELAADSQGQAQPGSLVTVPVQVSVAAPAALAGLQFRAVVQPQGSAPALAEPVLFTSNPALPAPIAADGLPLNQVAVAWSPLVNPFAAELTGQVQVGALSFRVPAGAAAGSSYLVQFANADGAPDLQTPYEIETKPGLVAVLAAPAGRANPSYKLSWLGQWGQRYVVESTTDPASGQWKVEAADLAGRGRLLEFVDQNPVGERKFYRVSLAP